MGHEVTVSQNQLPLEEVKAQVESIQRLMGSLMRNGEHYGRIPGCGDKPSLLKAGAEKLGFMFRLAPDFTTVINELPNGHREYEVVCKLIHIESKNFVGSGIGLASTMESKYRYRNNRKEVNTGKPVPKEYWDNDKDQKYLGGNGFQAKKIDNQWVIVKIEDKGKTENPDIVDVYNTVLKMAKKRAHVDAIITVTAASDIFTQDVEDTVSEHPQVKQTEARKSQSKNRTQTKENKLEENLVLDQGSIERNNDALNSVTRLIKLSDSGFKTMKEKALKTAPEKFERELIQAMNGYIDLQVKNGVYQDESVISGIIAEFNGAWTFIDLSFMDALIAMDAIISIFEPKGA